VWRACDGRTTAEELCPALGLDHETVMRALGELGERELVNSVPGAGVTRREAAARLAKVGAVAASAPLIYSIVAPAPALAASQRFCTTLGCQSGCGACHTAVCSCCGPGGGSSKLCTADCTAASCTVAIYNSFGCQPPVTTVTCN
jgi:hypothetical protein